MGDENNFYLGRMFDTKTGKVSTDPYYYDPADLTTHAVITGMTGSGKTGFCISLLEEAAMKGIPAVVVDPKGDLTNLLLHFPIFFRQISIRGLTGCSPPGRQNRGSAGRGNRRQLEERSG